MATLALTLASLSATQHEPRRPDFIAATSLPSSTRRSPLLDVVITHPSAASAVEAASKTAGAAARTAELAKLRAWRGIGGDDSGYSFVPVAVESYGRLGVHAARLLSEVADVAARGGVPKTAFVRMAHAELSGALVKGMGKVYAMSMQATVRAAGRGFQEGHPVPVAETVSE